MESELGAFFYRGERSREKNLEWNSAGSSQIQIRQYVTGIFQFARNRDVFRLAELKNANLKNHREVEDRKKSQ